MHTQKTCTKKPVSRACPFLRIALAILVGFSCGLGANLALNATLNGTLLPGKEGAATSSASQQPPHVRRRLQRLHRAALGPGRGIRWTLERTLSQFPVVYPVREVPNWGAMRSPAQWNRSYDEMTPSDFVPVPRYDLSKLLTPFSLLLTSRNDAEVTRKLFYSTKHFAAYDLDAGEYTAIHPGVDLKLPEGTPLSAIMQGRVHAVRYNDILGTHVILEHRHPTEGVLYSIYAHLGSVLVQAGQIVAAGDMIATVGRTGNTSAPHLHLQIDRGHGEAVHEPYLPSALPSPLEADEWTVNPMEFIERYSVQ